MPCRARLNPVSLARRQAAAARLSPRVVQAPGPQLAAGGPGPSTSAFLLSRNYGTTPPNRALTDFFRRKKEVVSPADTLLSPLSLSSRGGAAAAYYAYVDNLARSSRYLSGEEFTHIMETLLSNENSGFIQLLRQIYADLEKVHGIEVDASHRRAIVTGLARHSGLAEALAIARAHKEDMGMREWVALVTAAGNTSSAALDEVLAIAPAEDQVYAPLLAFTQRQPTESNIAETLRNIDKRGVTLGPWCEANLANLYATVDLPKAVQIVDAWNPAEVEDPELRRMQWSTLAHVRVAAGDVKGVVTALQGMEVADASATCFLVEQELLNNPNATDVLRATDKVQNLIGQDLSPAAWAELIALFLRGGSLRTAWDVYCNARNRATVTTADLADLFITTFTRVSPPELEVAMEVYDDLSRASEDDPTNPRLVPTASMYQKLLHACIAIEPPASTQALMLAKDMERRKIVISADSVAEVIITLMQTSSSHAEAYQAYMQLHNISTRFSNRQYITMVTGFISASYPGSDVAPPEFVMQMMQDMRRAGYPPGSPILTSLLKSYATLGKKARKKRLGNPGSPRNFQVSALLLAIRDIHVLINLDPVVAVDVPLLTALMDAFSSAGAFYEAFNVWDEIIRLYPSTPKSQAAQVFSSPINVIIDTCGFAENIPRARRIWAWGNRHNLVQDERNWAAWIEALCRFGKMDEALSVVCDQMGTDGIPQPTRDIASIVAKFSWRHPSQMGRIVDRLQTRFPQWDQHFASLVQRKQ